MQRLATLFCAILFFALCSPAVRAADGQNVDWLMYNGNYAGDRYSSLDQINRGNVGSLRPVCAFQLGELGPMQTGPVIHNGVMFLTTELNTYAIDARTCDLKWKVAYKPVGPQQGRANRGVALLGGKLFRGTPDAHLLALDEATGNVVWNVKVADSSDGSSTIAAPIAWKNLVFMGTAGGEAGIKGKMFAFDVNDGHQVWSFDMIPTANQTGANTWGSASTALTGGGATWTSFSLDTNDGSLFIPVGNPGPDFSAAYRAGNNLFTCSVVVLDATTGKLRWYYQLVPHDYHDWDVAAAPALYTGTNGKPMISVVGKSGVMFTLDRTTHAVVSKVPVTTVTNADAPLTTEGTHFCPGTLGGVEWNGPAYSPSAKLTYVNAVDWCVTLKLGEVRFVRGQAFLGSANGFGQKDDTSSGWLNAIDPVTGKIAWRYHADAPLVAAVTPTAGGVLFTGALSGAFMAFDAASGKMLYSFNTGGQMAGGVAPYMVDGKEYVAAVSGNQSRTSFPSAGAPMVFVFGL